MPMLRTFELRLKPKAVQRAELRVFWQTRRRPTTPRCRNAATPGNCARKRISYYDQQAELTELRRDQRFATIAVDIQREPLRRVDHAFPGILPAREAGQKPVIRASDLATVMIPSRGTFKTQFQRPAGSESWRIRFKASRVLAGTLKMASVIRCGDKWTARIVCDIGSAPTSAWSMRRSALMSVCPHWPRSRTGRD